MTAGMISLLLLQLFVSGCGKKENEDSKKQNTAITSSSESDELTDEQKMPSKMVIKWISTRFI